MQINEKRVIIVIIALLTDKIQQLSSMPMGSYHSKMCSLKVFSAPKNPTPHNETTTRQDKKQAKAAKNHRKPFPRLSGRKPEKSERSNLQQSADGAQGCINGSCRRTAHCNQAIICYNAFTMTHPTPIDITNMPDLVRIAEEVEATRKPRELRRENTPLALLTPVKKKQAHQAKSKAMKEALALAGTWKDLPSDKMEEDLDRIRHSSKPTSPLEL